MAEEYSLPIPMYTLFKNELKTQSSLLHDYLTILQSGHMGDGIIEKLHKVIHVIKGSARIIHYPNLIKICELLEKVFSNLKNGNTTIPEVLPSFFSVQKYLKNLSELDETFLGKNKNQKDPESKHIEFLLDKLLKREDISASNEDLSVDLAILNLFQIELENQVQVMTASLVALENKENATEQLKNLIRAAHSIKGSARIVQLKPIVELAHVLEDCFLAAENREYGFNSAKIDTIFKVVDLLSKLAKVPYGDMASWVLQESNTINELYRQVSSLLAELKTATSSNQLKPSQNETEEVEEGNKVAAIAASPPAQFEPREDRALRVSAHNLNRLMALAGESLVELRWLYPFNEGLQKLKKNILDLSRLADAVRESREEKSLSEKEHNDINNLLKISNECRQSINDRLGELDLFIGRHTILSDRLYREVIDSRMRPFADGIKAFPRMVRDIAKQLKKKIRLEILGRQTLVDRDILEKLEAPLAHLLRNAIDHGIEPPERRIALGKPPEGCITLEAQHKRGMLLIKVSDDGAGLDFELIRKKIIEKKLVKSELAAKLTDKELIEFLYLPGFTTIQHVTELSGRGFGLNIVQNMLNEVSGAIETTFFPERGTTFTLLLPLTLSVIRALIVEISREPYAIPLARIDRAIFVPQDKIEIIENRQYFEFEGNNVGLVIASQILEISESKINVSALIPIIVVKDSSNSYGIVVDNFLDEKELAVQELDSRLGKVKNISSGAFMEDGSPILVLDIEDIIKTIDNILTKGHLHRLSYSEIEQTPLIKKILVVDDSATVREIVSRHLYNSGYSVDTAIDGIDAWNTLRIETYDLVITDIDMPRLNGIELVRMIRGDSRLKKLPVMIVSYKERDEDRMAGLEAGANYYLIKSNFHDKALLSAVTTLIGKSVRK